MRKIAFICFLASISVWVCAQDITITPEIISPDGRTVVEYDNNICATEGATAIFRVTLEGYDYIESVSACLYTFNEVEQEASYTFEDGVITFDEISVPLVLGSNYFTFKLSIKETGKEELTELTKDATAIHIYSIPTHQEVSAPSSLLFYRETGELSWTAHDDGGAKWEYLWTSTENVSGSDDTFVHPSITNSSTEEKEVTVTLSATNYAPDGVTIWDSYSENWVIKILPTTVVETSVSPNTIDDPYKLFQGDSWNLAVYTDGGNSDGWNIEWIDGESNIVLGQGLEYTITGSSTENIENRHIILHVTNTSTEGTDTNNSSLYNVFFDYYVRFYPIPHIDFSAPYPKDVLDGEKIQMAVKYEDTAYADDYVMNCVWDGKVVDSASYLFEAVNSGNEDGIQKEITVRCSFGLVNSDATSSSQELSHTFMVWPKPNLYISAKENNPSVPNRQFQDGKWDFLVRTNGGFREGWTIVWKDENGKEVGRGENYTLKCDAPSDGVQEKHVILTITNVAKGRTDLWFEHTYNYYAAFYPVPIIQFDKEYPQNVLDGEKIPMTLKHKDTAFAEDYVIKYEWDGKVVDSASYLFEAVNSGNDDGIQKKMTVKCSLGLVNSEATSTQELSHTFMVWPKPNLYISANENNPSDPNRQFQDGKWDFLVRTNGGFREGWTIVWKDENGKEVGRGENYTLKCDAPSDGVQEKHVILTITNVAKGRTDLWFEHTYNYYAAFYPAPIVRFEKEYPHNIKHGDKVLLKLTVMDAKGNSLSDAYDWNCSWNNGQSNGISYEFVGNNQSNDDGVTKKIAVDCSIELKGTNLKHTYSREADFVVWPIPKVTATDIVNRVGFAGQTFDCSITTIGGKKDGWTYVWSLNNQKLDVNTNTFNLSLENPSTTDSIISNYKIRVTNTCDNVVWFNAEYPFTVIAYPEPKVPERIIVMDQDRGVEVSSGIREGNNLILHCDECTGGNPNAWSYKWLRNNSIFGTNNEINEKISSNYSGSGKANDMTIEYVCSVENMYNSISWKKQEYKKQIRVYRKPQTPTGLQRKGNGTSGTWIATCGMDDSSLGANDYYLVFGYRDANGRMHDVSTMKQQNIGEQRWSSSQQSFDGNAYVYALWKYDDGAEVTSGLCMESSIDENWDGSSYDGSTRSVIAETTGINFFPSVQTEDDPDYYSLDGLKVLQPRRGINIVRSKDGKVVKIINK